MSRDKRGRFTAERTTKTTHEVTERLTIEQDDTLVQLPEYDGPLNMAAGWNPGPIRPRHDWFAQRAAQVDQALNHLAMWDEHAEPGEPVPERVIREAVNILRAGPGASRMELTLGRSV
jgi:hypothetical protein